VGTIHSMTSDVTVMQLMQSLFAEPRENPIARVKTTQWPAFAHASQENPT
jgi:hypothetical protein